MRKTFRSQNNKNYWTERWESVQTDEIMHNINSYPLKHTIQTINYKEKTRKILEAGCVAGRILSYLHHKNYDVVGMDFVDVAIKKIIKKNNNMSAITGIILKTDFEDNSFDTIFTSGLYHNFEINDVKTAFSETNRILK